MSTEDLRLPDRVVGDAYTSDVAWDLLEDLVDVGNRMAGQAGEREAATLVAEAFETYADDVRIEEFEIPGWWRGDSALSLSAPRERTYDDDHDVIALPGTPSGSVEADLVDVGYGTDEEFADADLEGAIAMARSDVPEDHDRWLHRMEKYASACEAGAEAFVFRNHVEGALPPTGEVGYHERPGPIPAVGVSKELGARLARYCDRDGGCRLTLDVECRNEPATSRNVEAVVTPDGGSAGDATGEADEEVLVTAHLDAHDIAEGANDNGAGTALVVEVGRLLSQVADDLDCRVRLVPFGSEEIGLYGAYHCAETTDLESVKCVLNLDGAGSSRTLRAGTNGFDGVATLLEEVTDAYDAPLSTGDDVSPHGDQWAFVEHGVPAAMVSTESDSAGRGWGHTHADTLDKLDRRDLRATAIQVASAARAAATDEWSFDRRSRESIRDDLSEGYERELKVGGRWSFEG